MLGYHGISLTGMRKVVTMLVDEQWNYNLPEL
jgi:hypothetical protein